MIFLALSCSSVTAIVSEEATPSCTNACPDYSTSWSSVCPENSRCILFTNASPTKTVYLSYQVGCDGDGSPGSPQCNCATGPVLEPGKSTYYHVVNGYYTDCHPYAPLCLTEGLAILANTDSSSCAQGTRVEFTAGNQGNPFGRFDSYNLDIEPTSGGGVFYSIPVSFGPDISCAVDSSYHDCRTLFCDSSSCPDAYATPATGGCSDGRSPQVGCQDTFSGSKGFVVTYFPASGASCQDATPCGQ